MLYERYEQRVRRKVLILRQIYKYRFLLITLASIAFLSLSGIAITKGTIYDVSVPSSYVYSEDVDFSSKAMFSSVTYSYRHIGETTWVNEKPTTAGEYEVEIKTKQFFGGENTKVVGFTIEPKNITLDIQASSVVFGENPIIEAELAEGNYIDDVQFSYENLSQTESVAKVESITIKDSLGNDVTKSYDFKNASFAIQFTPRPVTVSLLDITDIYKGVVLTSNDIEITEGSLVEGDIIEIISSGSQLEVGSSLNTILTATILDNGVDVTSNYDITFEDGSLEVTTRPITIQTNSDTTTYDGTPFSSLNFEIIEGSIVDTHSINVISNTSITNVGTTDNILSVEILDGSGQNVTSNYDITYVYGELEVTTRQITIASTSDTKIYDGTPLFNSDYTVTEGSLGDGHTINVTSNVDITTVGTLDNEITVQILDSNDNDVSSNYELTYVYGQLDVTKRPITIQTNSDTKVYDGNILSNQNYVVSEGTLVTGDVINITDYTDITNVGVVDNVLIAEIFDSNSSSVTDNYDITYEYGLFEITARPITIQTDSDSKVYDGTALTNENYTITLGTLVAGDIINVTGNTDIANVGVVDNVLTLDILDSELIDVTSNYDITYEDGSLEVTVRPITIKPEYATKVYDGTELTSDVAGVTSGLLVNGHMITITTLGSQTNVGTSTNSILTVTIDDGGNDVTSNYDITYEDGSLEVMVRPITIKTEDATKVYDGTELTSDVAEVTSGSLVNGHTITITTSGSQTNVGTSTNSILTVTIDDGGTDVTSNYDITFTDGSLEVTPRPISVQTNSDTKVYDGTALTNENYTITAGTLVAGDTINVTDNTDISNVSVVDNVLTFEILDSELIDVTSNYNITYDNGTLEVTPRPITIKPEDVTKVYDGTELTSGVAEVTSGSLVNGHTITITTSGSQTNVGTSKNSILTVTIDDGGTDVTSNYDITYEDGSLEVTVRPITIKPEDATKVYNGTELTSDVAEVTSGSLVNGHTITITTSGSQTNVGTSTNSILTVTIDDGGTDVTSNYDITYEDGSLEVMVRPITIKPEDATKVYDGTELTLDVTEVISGSLVNGHMINITTSGSQLNVGTSTNSILTVTIDDGGTDVTSNYDITYEEGSLEVTVRPITIKPEDATKVYDGTELTSDVAEVTSGSLVNGHTITITTSGNQTNVGTSTNSILTVTIDDGGTDVTSNYDITFTDGSLEVTPRPISVQTNSDTKVYDGTALTNGNYTITSGTLVAGDAINVTANTDITNVGTVNNVLTLEILDSGLIDVTSNYNITFDNGTLEVTARPISVQTNSDTKVYDGTALFDENYTITSGTLVTGDTINVTANTDITNVGTVNNVLTLEILDSGLIDVTSNYNITFDNGTLEVTARPISVQTNSDTKVYDGTALFNENYTITSGTLVARDTINVTDNTDITNVGVVDNVLTLEILDSGLIDITSNYNITYNNGTLEVTPRPITIKPEYATKVYDGTELTSDVAEVTSGSLVNGHTIDIITSGSQLNVGTSTNSILTATVLDGAIDVSANYNITYQDGSLEVTPRPITIQTDNDSKIYDGTALSNENYTITFGTLVAGDVINVVTNAELTIVDVVDNVLSVEIETATATDVTSNYAITYEYGFLEVTPRTLVISTPGATKVYDGTPLTNDNWELTEGSVVLDHELTVTVTGTITEVGLTRNDFTYEIKDSSLNDVSMYYIVVENTGILEVEREKTLLVIQSNSDSKLYDGTPLTNNEWILFEGELLPNHTLDIVMTGTITNVGTTDNTFTYVVLDENDVDVTTDFYDVQVSYGELTILENNDNGANNEDSTSISNEGSLDDGPAQTVLEIYTETDDIVYLRDKSYGDYNKQGWATPTVYVSPYNVTPLLFPSITINNTLNTYELQVRALQTGLSYYLPYYSSNGFYSNYNDVYVNHTYGSTYSVDYTPITDVDYNTLSISDPTNQAYETEYQTFVYQNYLQIPRETREALLRIASENGLDPSSPTIIEDVQNYIKNAGVYNKAYNPIPNNVDVALYFLEESREGICQHFATAGVVMYRAMGIPARYVTGFVAQSSADNWVGITSNQAHAWVEIYIDGFGWVPIEVTAPDLGDGSDDGFGSEPGTDTGSTSGGWTSSNLIQLNIISGNDSKVYDGTPLTNPFYYSIGSLQTGHTLTVNVTGTITLVGETQNTFTYTIEDQNGNDVSDQYNVNSIYGSLVVVPSNDLEIIEFQVYDVTTVYNGQAIEHSDTDYWIPSQNLPANYTVILDIVGSITDVGKKVTYINPASVVILDENQIDVTSNYNIVTYEGSITVQERSISVTSFSARKDYDGQPLTSDIYYISQGSLAAGDEITVNITGSITDPGLAANTIESITIVNANGDDVTSNYDIDEIEGSLIVDAVGS
ncbi:hypothetical protein KHQ81_04600 [Mycoplasmatota bacterium]|nr:hypothetical protein KHQ81_04600 [Mycoplasmatota bacterium]